MLESLAVCWDLLTARKTWSDLFFEQTNRDPGNHGGVIQVWKQHLEQKRAHSVFLTVFFLSSINFKLHMLIFCCPLVATGRVSFWNTPPRVVFTISITSPGHSGLIFNTIVLLFYSSIWFLKILMWWRACESKTEVLTPLPQETGGKAWAYQRLVFQILALKLK